MQVLHRTFCSKLSQNKLPDRADVTAHLFCSDVGQTAVYLGELGELSLA